MSLKDRLAAQIAATGPLTIAQFMDAALNDPQDGYYATRPALGEAGDFITAPLVSQMFGELIGLWAISVWRALGSPPRFRLIETGPGDGTLISDLLRAAKLDAGFLAAMDLWLVETSEPLKIKQAPLAPQARWSYLLSDVPKGLPTILIGNEILDCLPARQFVRTDKGWAERMVGVDAGGRLTFGLTPSPLPGPRPGPAGAILEVSPAQEAFAAEIAQRLVADGGAALLIDYGRADEGFGDTLQALRHHQKVDVLETVGEADLTVHADFPAVMAAARAQGAAAALAPQGEFLHALGVVQRARVLADRSPDKAATIHRQLERLTGPDQMGELFKVCCLYYPHDLVPPGFEEA
jgi:SAM-dependent MidA family methyltransferase